MQARRPYQLTTKRKLMQNPIPSLAEPSLYINRELSWLEFNQRVLEEAQDPSNPLLERVKFLCIGTCNLGEFFGVRVAGLNQQRQSGISTAGPDGMSPTDQLAAVSARVRQMLDDQYSLWNKALVPPWEVKKFFFFRTV